MDVNHVPISGRCCWSEDQRMHHKAKWRPSLLKTVPRVNRNHPTAVPVPVYNLRPMVAEFRRRNLLLKVSGFAAALAFAAYGAAQQAPPIFQGGWTATESTTTYQGSWSAQTYPGKADSGHGRWGVLDENGRIVLEGTWKAEKIAPGWKGTWTARMPDGRSVSGTWLADMTGSSGKTFQDMLKRTLEAEIAGSWRTGQREGNWWIKGLQARRAIRPPGKIEVKR